MKPITEALRLAILAQSARVHDTPLDNTEILKIENELFRLHVVEVNAEGPGFWAGFISGALGAATLAAGAVGVLMVVRGLV